MYPTLTLAIAFLTASLPVAPASMATTIATAHTTDVEHLLPEPGTLAAAMLDLVAARDTELETIEKELADQPKVARRIELRSRLVEVKRNTDLNLLHVQAEFALARGDLNLVAELEAALERMINPPDMSDPTAKENSRKRSVPQDRGGDQ